MLLLPTSAAQDLADYVARHMSELTLPDLVDVLVALADLRYHPGGAWVARHTACCNACVGELSAYQIRLMGNATAAMRELSEADWLPRKGEVV